MKRLSLVFAIGVIFLASPAAGAWDSSRLTHPVMINDNVVPYPVFAIFVMPGTPLSVGFVDADGGATITFAGREVDPEGPPLVAPKKPGLEVLEIRNNATGESCRINVFTMVPAGAPTRDMIIEPPKHKLEKPVGST